MPLGVKTKPSRPQPATCPSLLRRTIKVVLASRSLPPIVFGNREPFQLAAERRKIARSEAVKVDAKIPYSEAVKLDTGISCCAVPISARGKCVVTGILPVY
jgi:hypothetical protein